MLKINFCKHTPKLLFIISSIVSLQATANDFFAKASKSFNFYAVSDFLGQFREHNESKTHSPNVLGIVMKEKRKVLTRNYKYGLLDEIVLVLFSLRSIIGGKIKPVLFKKF